MSESAIIRPPARTRAPTVPPAAGGAVLITGICGRLGKQLARVLHRERAVVGVDRRPFLDKPKDIEHAQVDIRRKKLKDVFRPVILMVPALFSVARCPATPKKSNKNPDGSIVMEPELVSTPSSLLSRLPPLLQCSRPAGKLKVAPAAPM